MAIDSTIIRNFADAIRQFQRVEQKVDFVENTILSLSEPMLAHKGDVQLPDGTVQEASQRNASGLQSRTGKHCAVGGRNLQVWYALQRSKCHLGE